MKAARAICISWLPLACSITGLCLLIQLTVQQNYRQSLNDPQIQMAEDLAAKLGDPLLSESEFNAMEQQIYNTSKIDIATSLAPWIGMYDLQPANEGYGMTDVMVSSGLLDGESALPPAGVLEGAKTGLPVIVGHHITSAIPANENRISWQPRDGVRQAIVVVYVPQRDMFVIAGRNMREVENREEQLGIIVLLAWACIMAATLVIQAFVYSLK